MRPPSEMWSGGVILFVLADQTPRDIPRTETAAFTRTDRDRDLEGVWVRLSCLMAVWSIRSVATEAVVIGRSFVIEGLFELPDLLGHLIDAPFQGRQYPKFEMGDTHLSVDEIDDLDR